MKPRSHWPPGERAARSRLAKLLHDEPFVLGSVVEMAHTCGKSGCRCARGEKHGSLALGVRRDGRRVMIHVPRALEGRARRCVENWREVKALLGRISDHALGRFLREKEARAGRGSRGFRRV